MINKQRVRRALLGAFCCMFLSVLFGQNSNEPKSLGNTYLIENVILHSQPGITKDRVSILIEKGTIKQIGQNIITPFDAQIIKADSMHAYAGFIATISHVGIKKEDKKQRPNVDDPGNPPNSVAGISPQKQASSIIDPTNKSIESYRGQGFTIAQSVPEGRMLPGQGAIITLEKADDVDDLLIKDKSGLFVQLKSASGVFPSTTIGVISKWKEMYKNAELAKSYEDRYALNPLGMKKPVINAEIRALIPASQKKQKVYFKAEKALDIHRVLAMHKNQNFDLVLVEAKQANSIGNKVNILRNPILLSLDLPKEIKEEKKDSTKQVDEETSYFIKRKMEAYQKHLSQAGELEKNNVPFAFSYLEVKNKDVFPSLKRMIKAGLSEEKALAGLTTIPAKLLEIDKIAGTVEVGKMANLVISNKPIFEEKTAIRYVFVNGQKQEFKEKKKKDKKPKGDDEDEQEDLAGEWTYEIEIPGQTQTGNLILEKEEDSYKLKISNDQDPGEYEDVEEVSYSGNNISFPFQVQNEGMTLDLTFSLDFDEGSFEGTVSVGAFGSFPITGSKTDPK